jgi:hypothetical protein
MIRLVRLVRNVEFAQLFDTFFITAITTILVVRFYLKITGYPQIGGSTLHISHLLPGMLLMLLALMVLLGAVNRAARGFAAVTGGLGFGLAWDELGKFITNDNNYFFHATPGLIYLTFVILYLIVRYSSQRRFTEDDYMANLLDLIKDAAIKDLDPREYQHAKELLGHVSKSNALYGPAKEMLERVRPTAARQPSLLDRIINDIKKPLVSLSRREFFSRLVVGIAVAYGFAALVASVLFFAAATLPDNYQVSTILRGDETDFIGGLSALISAVLAGAATYKYRQGRASRAFRLFEQSLLVNIFIGQVVLFFKSEGVAIFWLAVTLFLLVNLELLSGERKTLKPTP